MLNKWLVMIIIVIFHWCLQKKMLKTGLILFPLRPILFYLIFQSMESLVSVFFHVPCIGGRILNHWTTREVSHLRLDPYMVLWLAVGSEQSGCLMAKPIVYLNLTSATP